VNETRANVNEMWRLNVLCELTFGIGPGMPTSATARTNGVKSTFVNGREAKCVRVTKNAGLGKAWNQNARNARIGKQ
jgi:hypothetical protein